MLSSILGSILSSYLKKYLYEEKAAERLIISIIRKCKLIIEDDKSTPNSKEIKMKNIYKLALSPRRGQFENFQANLDSSGEAFKLAQQIKGLVERLAIFLKEKELNGLAKIFFKNGSMVLGIILYKCKIQVTYSLLTDGLSSQVIIITSTKGGDDIINAEIVKKAIKVKIKD